MKKSISLALLIFFAVSCFAATNYKMNEYPFYGNIQLSLMRLSDGGEKTSTAGLNPSLQLGYNLNSYFALEAEGAWGQVKPSDPETSGIISLTTSDDEFESTTTLFEYSAGIKFHVFPRAMVSPYLTTGIGQIIWSVENDSIGNSAYNYDDSGSNSYLYAGLGFENKLSDRFSLNFDYKHSFIMGDAVGMIGGSAEPTSCGQFGVGFSVKLGRGVYEKVDLAGIESIHFEFNSIRLTKESKKILKKVAEAMKKNPDLVLEVRGYTDNTGSDAINRRMSKKRAITVKQILVDMGITSHRLITTGMGHNDPIATNATPEGRAMNRRVEFYELEN